MVRVPGRTCALVFVAAVGFVSSVLGGRAHVTVVFSLAFDQCVAQRLVARQSTCVVEEKVAARPARAVQMCVNAFQRCCAVLRLKCFFGAVKVEQVGSI
jgi:hypothetical protein